MGLNGNDGSLGIRRPPACGHGADIGSDVEARESLRRDKPRISSVHVSDKAIKNNTEIPREEGCGKSLPRKAHDNRMPRHHNN
jgi:hypothetical protein